MAKENTINGGGGVASTQSNSIDSKASVLSGYSLSTSAQTIVSAINEIDGKLSYVIDLNILTGIDPNTALNSPLIKAHIISGATVEEAIGGFDGLVNAVNKNIPIIGRLQISQYDSIQITNDIKISPSTFLSGGSLTVLLVAPVNQIYQDSERSIKILKYSFILHISMTNDSVTAMSLPLTEPLSSFPDSMQSLSMLNSTIIIGQDSVETILYKVSAGVPYVYIESPGDWDETLYSPATQEQVEEWFYNNCRSGLYKLDDIMSGTYRTTGGTTGETFSLVISSSLFDTGEGPKAVGLEESIRPLIYLSGNIDFITDENGIWEYDISSWKMKSFEISTKPIENVADYGSRGVVLGYTNSNKANGRGSIAEGFGTETSGDYSHAEGYYTQTFAGGEHAEGSFNLSNNGLTIHSVGIGSSNDDRKNAHEIMTNGDQFVYGLGGYDGTNSADAQTLQEVINSKQETITPGTGLEMTPERVLNVTLDTTVFKVVSVLPDSPTQGDENKIHLVPAESTGANNAYTEYVWVNSAWEILGEYTSEVDLTPYLKTVDAESTYLKITDAESSYQKITDDALNTTSKTIVGAINEILPKVTGVGKVDPNSNGTGEVFNVYEGSGANVASGQYAHAEGYKCTASGLGAHAEGQETAALGSRSHAEGVETTASAEASHAEGGWTEASKFAAHAEGSHTIASGRYSHTEGYYTEASGIAAHAEGEYNFDDSFAIHMVGIGTSEYNRKNAHVIESGTGDHFIIGIGGYEGQATNTAQSLQTVITGLQSSIRTRQSEQTVYTEVPELTADYQIPANDTFVERVYIIPVGDTLYSVTGDSSILWAGGIAPNPSANSVLVVSIVKNLATWNAFMPI